MAFAPLTPPACWLLPLPLATRPVPRYCGGGNSRTGSGLAGLQLRPLPPGRLRVARLVRKLQKEPSVAVSRWLCTGHFPAFLFPSLSAKLATSRPRQAASRPAATPSPAGLLVLDPEPPAWQPAASAVRSIRIGDFVVGEDYCPRLCGPVEVRYEY